MRKDNIQPINLTTYESEMICGDKVEIGNRESVDFKPHLKLNRWGGECFIKVEIPTTRITKPILENSKVRWLDTDIEYHFYPLEANRLFEQNELGGFEFEIILKKKPAGNKVTFGIEVQGLSFHYQPELTLEEVSEGTVRPDNVVGSYAVYHATKEAMHFSKANADKYRCGKAFHIYRPKATDAKGNWAWCSLSINKDKGILAITTPQWFLDGAIYPVSIDPDFGYTGHGNSATSSDYIFSNQGVSPASDGIGVSISCYVKQSGTSSPSRAALYDSADSSLDGQTEEKFVPVGEGWLVHNFIAPAPAVLSTESYWICMTQKTLTYYYYDVVAGEGRYKALTWNNGFPGWPDPVGVWGSTNWGRKLSIFCTYAPAGWTGKIAGVTNPAKIMGVDVANIAKVKGVG